MQAAFCTVPGKVHLRETTTPKPGPDEILVRVRSCGICGSDLHWFHGLWPPPAVCPGHEIAGEVAEVGSAVTDLDLGQRVAVEPLVICGKCSYCRTGDYQLCRWLQILGTVRDGGLADYVLVPGRAAFRLPDALDFELGALAEPTAVCVHAVRLAGVRLGDRVLVLGAGTIGLLSVLAARAAGATEVAVTARHPHQREMARRCGATRVFATDEEGERERFAFASEEAVDVVIETVGGAADTLEDAIQCVRPGGTVVVLGVFSSRPACNALLLMLREIRIIGSLTYGRSGARADFDVALGLLAANAQRARQLITHRFPLDDVQQAFETAADKKRGAIKVAVEPR